MNNKAKIVIGFIIVCLLLVFTIILLTNSASSNKSSINTFQKYLVKNKEYISSKNICTRESEKSDDLTNEKYTEIYNFTEHTFTTILVHYNNSDQSSNEFEYIYDFNENTVTLNMYDTNESRDNRDPNTIYSFSREEVLDCIKGNHIEIDSVFYNQILESMQDIKKVVKNDLEEAGIILKDII